MVMVVMIMIIIIVIIIVVIMAIYAHLFQLQNMQIIHTFLFFVHTSRSGINPIFLSLKHFMPFDIVIQNSLKIESPP